ncbi:hypothetical protein BN1708_007469 [Verticillium longisporum]|uniref:Uncharacterized protein n=1 Tax=Verticillium longisporum TaxID=100787 RepID=A0A0G4MU02_VERLO|nr:hypothetical protein BN1708_007469 [Verticillium longisporum]
MLGYDTTTVHFYDELDLLITFPVVSIFLCRFGQLPQQRDDSEEGQSAEGEDAPGTAAGEGRGAAVAAAGGGGGGARLGGRGVRIGAGGGGVGGAGAAGGRGRGRGGEGGLGDAGLGDLGGATGDGGAEAGGGGEDLLWGVLAQDEKRGSKGMERGSKGMERGENAGKRTDGAHGAAGLQHAGLADGMQSASERSQGVPFLTASPRHSRAHSGTDSSSDWVWAATRPARARTGRANFIVAVCRDGRGGREERS